MKLGPDVITLNILVMYMTVLANIMSAVLKLGSKHLLINININIMHA